MSIPIHKQGDCSLPLIIYSCISTKQEIDQPPGSVLLAMRSLATTTSVNNVDIINSPAPDSLIVRLIDIERMHEHSGHVPRPSNSQTIDI